MRESTAMNDTKNRLFKASELAELLQVSVKTIYKAGQKGLIPSYKVGKSIRFEMPKERIVEDKDK